MKRLLELAFRKGFIPLCCGGASGCFAIYSIKVSKAADQWLTLSHSSTASHYSFKRQAETLKQHAATSVVLSMTSAMTALEARKDWKQYRTLSTLDEMERWLLQKRPFFFRSSVLGVALVSASLANYATGGIRLLQPSPPVV